MSLPSTSTGIATEPVPTVEEPSPRHRKSTATIGGSLWWLVLPGALVFAYVVLLPTAQGAYYAFTDWNLLTRNPEFIGWDNFIDNFRGDAGPAALRTLFIALVVVVAQNALGLLLALLLNGRIIGRGVLRTIIFAPMVISALVVGYLFKYIFGAPDQGAVNTALKAFGLPQVDFLGNPTWAFWIIVTAIIWQFTGSSMVIYLAGLQGVPVELEEAASLDGAGYWLRFWYIVRPLLAPAITINLMLGLIGGLKIFDQIFAITGGGPGGQTETITTQLYLLFSKFGYYGRAAALALVLAVAIGILSYIQFRVLRRQELNS